MPIWTSDGRGVTFASRRNGTWGLYTKLADNSRMEELLIETELPAIPMSWSPDSRLLVFSMGKANAAGSDIWSVARDAPDGKRVAMPVVHTAADERTPQVSPDGRWLAYSSNETGRSEIYVKPFPEGPGRIQVSVDGGVYPRWRRDSRELYFLNLLSAGGMMASTLQVSGDSIQRSVPQRLFQSAFVTQPHAGGRPHAFAVTGDGQRFLIPQFDSPFGAFGNPAAFLAAVSADLLADRRGGRGAAAGAAPITVVLEWTTALRR